jgi:dihydrofolate synthase/folylpolyglutamate synthase
MFGARFGLEHARALVALAGDPQQRLRFIHVAGTNGKGSTCALIESMYRAAGYRVGLFTSPHLVSFRERIQINRECIRREDFARLASELAALMERGATAPASGDYTLFEFITVLALRHFAEQQCDVIVWETGLGGRLDATNIVTPLASVITNIGLDHQQWLGETLEQIAAEKAGIIKRGVPVVTGVEQPEVRRVIETVARNVGAPIKVVKALREDLPVPGLRGAHQLRNAALAVSTVETLQGIIPVSRAAVVSGLTTVNWPGRLQLLTRATGQRVLLDGAHNQPGVEALLDALPEFFPEGKAPTLILGMMRDKDCAALCARLAPAAGRILLVPVSSERSAAARDLEGFCKHTRPEILTTVHASLSEAVQAVSDTGNVLITGSLYLIGEALALLDPERFPASDEMELNQWQGRK